MDSEKIDALILSEVGAHWKKVARVIAVVLEAFNAEILKLDELGLVVQARIEALAESGLLVSQGNLENWLRSEIRRA
ncbi:DUF3658 domain-containing protein [Undibacterium sp. TJN25]|uniref:DUF3658 domain-containing protein n=1 Tax=Undibacterium sp. TJN25 TaxID=3413056 RepID=UPI003BF14D5F